MRPEDGDASRQHMRAGWVPPDEAARTKAVAQSAVAGRTGSAVGCPRWLCDCGLNRQCFTPKTPLQHGDWLARHFFPAKSATKSRVSPSKELGSGAAPSAQPHAASTSRRAEALAVYRVCECLKTERPSPSSSADPPAAAKGRTFVPATLLATFVGAAVAETLGGSRVEGALRDGAANDDSHSPAEEKNPSIPPSEFVPSLEAAFDAGFAAASSLRSRRSAARPPWVPASFDGERAEAARDALDALVGAEAAFARLAATGETSGVYRRSSEEAIARSPQKPPLRRRAETDAPDESGAAARTRAEKGSFHHTSVANKESVADRLARKKARAEAALAAKRAARLDAERAECTFAPRISAASSAIVGSSGSRPRSFVRATEKYLTREEREALEAAACTFAPRITPRPRYLGKDPNATRREEEEKRRRAKERRRQSARDAPWEGPPPWESPPQKPRPQKKKPGTRERTRASSASPGTKTRAPASRGAPRGGSFGTAPASGPLARRPSGFEATVARLRAASAARAEAAKAARSAVDRRAAWIDPRAAEKKTAAEKTRDAARAKAAAAAEMPAAWRASENARRDEATPAKTRGVSGGSKASATRDDGAETPGAKNEPGGPLSPALAKLSSTYTPGILPPRPDRAAFDASAAGEAAAFERAGRDADASEALAARTPADESPTVTMRVPPSPGGGRSGGASVGGSRSSAASRTLAAAVRDRRVFLSSSREVGPPWSATMGIFARMFSAATRRLARLARTSAMASSVNSRTPALRRFGQSSIVCDARIGVLSAAQ